MALPWITEERRQILPTALKERLRDDAEIATYDHWRVTEGMEHDPKLALAETKTRLDKQSCRYIEKQAHE
jgi:hypothetical protein